MTRKRMIVFGTICTLILLWIGYRLVAVDLDLEIAAEVQTAQETVSRIVYYQLSPSEARQELSKMPFDEIRTTNLPNGGLELSFRAKVAHPLNWMDANVYGMVRFEHDHAVAWRVEVHGKPL